MNVNDPIVVTGYAIRLPGGVNSIEDFEQLLFAGRSAIGPMPADRYDRDLYFDAKRGVPGKAYTQLGGCVDAWPLDQQLEHQIAQLGTFDLTHRQFAQVACRAWSSSLHAVPCLQQRCGIFVGHSGGTDQGGPLAMSGLADVALAYLDDVAGIEKLSSKQRDELKAVVVERLRADRPRPVDDSVHFNAYSAASLAARLLGLAGPREVIDAACASSLIGLSHAITAIEHGHMDAAIVGGATYNNIDNLILFSQSQACSDQGSCPFDRQAGGLISSEGYVAITITKQSIAQKFGLRTLGVIQGVGVASDGRGKSLWAPRTEGQQLAIRRGYRGEPLTIDYLEAHATSTQVGDATEIQSLSELLKVRSEVEGNAPTGPLRIGSAKSNLGHTLEAAGLVGLVKLLIAMRRGEIPPSINFHEAAPEIAAVEDQIRVVDRVTPWPARNQTKRCAVNAFGIGGLNGHAILSSQADRLPAHQIPFADEPIAIVGRGVVLPGSMNVPQFVAQLQQGDSAITEPSAKRWRDKIGVQSAGKERFTVPTHRGGYIEGYQFNGQPYRIPPKQVQLANPIQIMLIDAVAQAILETDGGKWSTDRQRTSVVVGTIFGGEFSHQLQVGLRLPEICREIGGVLSRQGCSAEMIDTVLKNYRTRMLQQFSALLDETGSFTASTLASRIAKTFDLMGGACAMDADDASGNWALMVAADQLRSGKVDAVVCGVSQRSLDLVAYRDLLLRDRLVRSGRVSDIPQDCSQILPGEGVAVLMLKRLSDAQRDGNPIFAVIDDFQCGTSAKPLEQRHRSMSADPINQQIVQSVGYLPGAHSVVRLIAETARWQTEPATTRITAIADDGFYVECGVRHPLASVVRRSADYNSASPIAVSRVSPTGQPHLPAPATVKSSLPTVMSSRSNPIEGALQIEGATAAEFEAALNDAISHPESYWESCSEDRISSTQARYVAAMVVQSPGQLAKVAQLLWAQWQTGKRVGVLDRELGLLWDRSCGRNRVAWAFPGQGSQYSAIPAFVQEDAGAVRFLQSFDEVLSEFREPPISPRLQDDEQQLGHDVWWTQLWVLAVSAGLADSLQRAGLRPDIVFGHSFGECGAALHAGMMSLGQAIRFAKQRSDAVVMTTRERGQLLSVRATPNRVDAILTAAGVPFCITHHNAPEQTVVAGTAAEIAKAKETLQRNSIASVVIPVPAAFHSPALESAKQKLRIGFGHERLRPPSLGFFSMMQTRYLAEADEVRDSLVDQLTEPLLYCSGVNRIVQDGCGLLIDVGPSDMLNRLHRSIVGQDALCISLDSQTANHAERLQWIELASKIVRGSVAVAKPAPSQISAPSSSAKTVASPAVAAKPVPVADEIEILDVTRRGRNRERTVEPTTPTRANTPVVAPETAFVPVAPVSVSHATTAASEKPSIGQKQVEQFLVDLVVELTGYSPEVIDFQADLEAELGVDSIKKAQVIGELAEWASIELDLRSMKLSQFQTLGDIAQLAAGMVEAGVVAEGQSNHFDEAQELDEPQYALSQDTVVTATPAVIMSRESSIQQLESWMIDFVVDQTGYSPDIIDMEADLEAELGVDSIKKAQLLGELVNHYDLSSIDLRKLKLSQFMTLASIRDFIAENVFPAETELETSAASSEHSAMNGSQPAHAALMPTHSHATESNGYHAAAQTQRNGHVATDVKKKRIRRELRNLIDAGRSPSSSGLSSEWITDSFAELATEAGIHSQSLAPWISGSSIQIETRTSSIPVAPIPAHGACRFGLKLEVVPRLPGMPQQPQWNGDALVLGHNPLASELVSRLQTSGVTVHQITSTNVADLDAELDRIWLKAETPHLFITSPHDPEAVAVVDARQWAERRDEAIVVPFRTCQRWMQRMIDQDRMPHATLATVVNAGGEFGFGGQPIAAPESGAMAGLTKAMLIESWMRGFRETPMKVIDIRPVTSVRAAVDGILRELACPSHDEEVVVDGEQRWAVRPEYLPFEDVALSQIQQSQPITRGGTWIISGGGRGITALTAMALAEQHDLKLHLLGTAPHPQLSDAIRSRATHDRPALRREMMHQAQQQGRNPIETWRDTEKAIEIDITLQACKERGIEAHYHSVDVSNADEVATIIAGIRQQHGPIRGVIHGAGAGQDARFDRKRIDKVEKCIRAKVDGAYALADATKQDPLEWFVGFGSISGRFGANGHTDYSLANDMLAKVIGQLKERRPETACVTFHWHAWGDIGMATKPEAKLALEMIGMEFMPADEGLQHFLNEFQTGGQLTEVLITDRNYIRKFFPGFGESSSTQIALPLLDPSGTKRTASHSSTAVSDPSQGWSVTFDPNKDRFLVDHRISGLPTLPFVIAIEMMAEAATQAIGKPARHFRKIEALHPIKFSDGDTFAIEVLPAGDAPTQWQLVADLRRKDGRIVKAGLVRFRGTFEPDTVTAAGSIAMPTRIHAERHATERVWPIQYLEPDAPIYHGETLQCLRSLQIDGQSAVGVITAPSLVQLGGVERPADGWLVPCAVMDAMLYASAVLAYHVAQRGSLPVQFESIDIGRLPEPGEPLQVHVKMVDQDQQGATLDVDLVGLNDDHLLAIRNYRLHWLQ